MPVHHLANIGRSVGACALWRAHRERQQEVPYATMVTPASVVVAGDPGYQPAQPEPLSRCLCGAMTVKTGAIVIGALNIIVSCRTALAIFIDMMDSQFDPGAFFGVLLAASAYVSFNSLLVHGARTVSHCLVLSWVAFQATVTGLKSAGLLIVALIFLLNPNNWRVMITMTLVGGAILALQWCFFVVGLRLANHLSRKKVQDSKREEFRKYLEKNGVMEVLTRCLVSLYEEPEKPADALQYVRNTLGAASPDKVELESLRVVVAEMKEKMMILEEENKDLRTKVASLRLDEEGATEEGDVTTDGGDPSPAPPADKEATKDKPEKK